MRTDLTGRTYLFVVDDTLAEVEAGSGFDLDTFSVLPGDDDLVPVVARILADRLAN